MKALVNEQLAIFPNPTEKSRWIFQLSNSNPAFFTQHQQSIETSQGFWASSLSPPDLLIAIRQLLNAAPPLARYWAVAERQLMAHPAFHRAAALDRDATMDAALRYRVGHGGAIPAQLRRTIRACWPKTSLHGAWNTVPDGRWRRAREAEALRYYARDHAATAYADQVAQAKAAALRKRAAQLAGYSGATLHRIASAQIKRDSHSAREWEARADAAARAEGLGSRFDYDNQRRDRRSAEHLAVQVRQDERQQRAHIRRLRAAAATAERQGDAGHALTLRRQAADLRRITIDPTTGEHVMTQQSPTCPAAHGGARPGAGGTRPGAGRKPLFAPAPPEPSAAATTHADARVALARRWSHHAGYLQRHFTYHTDTGEVTGPSGKALDLRHPVSTPLGALRPGLLLAALLHGTVTRRYGLADAGQHSTWPAHRLTVTVVDSERDTGACQLGTPAHLLVPPAPRVRRGGGR